MRFVSSYCSKTHNLRKESPVSVHFHFHDGVYVLYDVDREYKKGFVEMPCFKDTINDVVLNRGQTALMSQE